MSDFKAKTHKIRFPLGFRPDPAGGAYSAPQTFLLYLRGATSIGREGEEKVGRRERDEDGGREERGGARPPPNILSKTAPVQTP